MSVAASGWGIVLVAASGWGIVLVAVAVATGRAFTDGRGPMAVFSSLAGFRRRLFRPGFRIHRRRRLFIIANDEGCGVGRAPTSTTATTASSEGSVGSEEAWTSGVGLATTDQVPSATADAAVSGRFAS